MCVGTSAKLSEFSEIADQVCSTLILQICIGYLLNARHSSGDRAVIKRNTTPQSQDRTGQDKGPGCTGLQVCLRVDLRPVFTCKSHGPDSGMNVFHLKVNYLLSTTQIIFGVKFL